MNELKGHKIICYGRKITLAKKPGWHPLYQNHRCQRAVVEGDRG